MIFNNFRNIPRNALAVEVVLVIRPTVRNIILTMRTLSADPLNIRGLKLMHLTRVCAILKFTPRTKGVPVVGTSSEEYDDDQI